MTPLKFEIILLLIGIGFGPTAPLTQVALQNTVAMNHLGTAIGTMSFCRTLVGTIMVAVFGAIVLAGTPGGTGTLAAIRDVSQRLRYRLPGGGWGAHNHLGGLDFT